MDVVSLSPLVEAFSHVAGAMVLGGWAVLAQRLRMKEASADLVYHALDSAVHWAESEIGTLSHDHLDNIQLKNAFLAKGLEYLNTHVPDALKRLKLDDVEQEEKLIVALSRYLGSKLVIGEPMVLGHAEPVPASAPALAPMPV